MIISLNSSQFFLRNPKRRIDLRRTVCSVCSLKFNLLLNTLSVPVTYGHNQRIGTMLADDIDIRGHAMRNVTAAFGAIEKESAKDG